MASAKSSLERRGGSGSGSVAATGLAAGAATTERRPTAFSTHHRPLVTVHSVPLV